MSLDNLFDCMWTGDYNECPCRFYESELVCQPYTITNLPKDIVDKCEKYFKRVNYNTFENSARLSLDSQNISIGKIAEFFPKIVHLKLKSVALRDFDPYAFSNVDELAHIDIIDSKIEQIKDGVFDHAIGLQSIDLTGTELANPRYEFKMKLIIM